MSRLQLLVIPVLTCLILMFSGVFQSQPSPLLSMTGKQESPLPPVAFRVEPVADAGLARVNPLAVLDQAIQLYQPANVPWLTMKLWQRAEFQELAYQVEGDYLEAPQHRMRLVLRVAQQGSPVRMELVSDGKSFYEAVHYAGVPAEERWHPFSASGRSGEPVSEQLQQEILRDKGYPGLTYLLHTIRENLRNPQMKAVLCNGHPMLEIRGTWPASPPAEANQAVRLPPDVVVEECCLYLDRESLWPYRLEWWGKQEGDAISRLILQTEYREPVVNQPLNGDEAEKTFAVPPMKKKPPLRGL